MRSSLCFLRRLQMPFFVSFSLRLGFSKSGLILTPVTGGCLGDDGQTTLGHPHHPLILPWLPPAPCLLYYAGLCYRSCYANELTLKQKISLLRPITHCSSIHLETDTDQTAHTPSTQCCEWVKRKWANREIWWLFQTLCLFLNPWVLTSNICCAPHCNN